VPDFTNFERVVGEFRVVGNYCIGRLCSSSMPGSLPGCSHHRRRKLRRRVRSLGSRLAAGPLSPPVVPQHRFHDRRSRGRRNAAYRLAAVLERCQSQLATRSSWQGTTPKRDGAAAVIVSSVRATGPGVSALGGYGWHY